MKGAWSTMAARSKIAAVALLVLAAGAAGRVSWAQVAPRSDQPRRALRTELDIAYAHTNHPRQRLDLYLPQRRTSKKPLPVIAYIHGGAWLGGDKRGGRRWLQSLVESGDYAGVSIGYRLSQHARWPAQIHDCKAAIRWIRAHAEQFDLDPDRIGVMGTSAGGHLVAMLGTSGGVAELEGELGADGDASSRVTCVIDFFGPSDLLTIGDPPSRIDHNAADSPESKLIGGPLRSKPRAARSASPTTFVSEDDPPFLIVHGSDDLTVPYQQSVVLREALGQVGVEVALITMQDGGHGRFRNPALEQRMRTFWDKHLLGKPAELRDDKLPAVVAQD